MMASAIEQPRMKLASATPKAELASWFDAASPGERAQYASGFTLAREADSVKFAGHLQAIGAAHLTQDRDPSDARLWRYWIEKVRDARLAVPPAEVGKAAIMSAKARALLALLRTLAARHEMLPSYAELAVKLELRPGLRGREQVRTLLRRLQASGAIVMLAGTSTQAPVVTIMKRGRGHGQSTKSGKRKAGQ